MRCVGLRMRAVAASISLFIMNIIGLGLGLTLGIWPVHPLWWAVFVFLGAALLSALVQKWEDFVIILIMLLVNAGLDFFQEHRALNALAALKARLANEQGDVYYYFLDDLENNFAKRTRAMLTDEKEPGARAAALEVQAARCRAGQKFDDPGRLFLTREALEQATLEARPEVKGVAQPVADEVAEEGRDLEAARRDAAAGEVELDGQAVTGAAVGGYRGRKSSSCEKMMRSFKESPGIVSPMVPLPQISDSSHLDAGWPDTNPCWGISSCSPSLRRSKSPPWAAELAMIAARMIPLCLMRVSLIPAQAQLLPLQAFQP